MTSAAITDRMPVKGKLRIIGNIDIKEPDGRDGGHYPMAMLIEFGSVEEIRKALAEGICQFEFCE